MPCIVVFCKQPTLLWLPVNSWSRGMQCDDGDDFDHCSIYCLYVRLREGEGFYLFVFLLFFHPCPTLFFWWLPPPLMVTDSPPEPATLGFPWAHSSDLHALLALFWYLNVDSSFRSSTLISKIIMGLVATQGVNLCIKFIGLPHLPALVSYRVCVRV